jgi:hypothetical protein
MLFCEDTSDEMERGLLERFEMDRGFFVSLGSPPTGRPCDHPECGEGEESDAGEKGGAMEEVGAKEGEKGGAKMPGEPAEEREEGPWSGEGRDFKEGEGEPIDDKEDSKAALALCGLFSSCSPSSSSSSSSPPPPSTSNWPLGARVLPSWSNLVASIS